MNKLVKGSVAAAAGIALLMGGAGSLALWNDSATVNGGTISAGTLTVAAPAVTPATDGWKNAAGVAIDISTYRIVPGDTIKFVKTLNVTAIGDTLTAGISVDTTSITVPSGNAAKDVALKSFITSNATFTVDGVSTSSIVAAAGTRTVVVTASITFSNGIAGAENAAKGGVVNLDNFALKLVQTV